MNEVGELLGLFDQFEYPHRPKQMRVWSIIVIDYEYRQLWITTLNFQIAHKIRTLGVSVSLGG